MTWYRALHNAVAVSDGTSPVIHHGRMLITWEELLEYVEVK